MESKGALGEEESTTTKVTTTIIKLNVGGVHYTTTLATLTTLEAETSMLAAMFREKRFSLVPETDGSYFIDRSGSRFAHILDYLRDGKVYVAPELRPAIIQEAEYFGLHKLATELAKPVALTSYERIIRGKMDEKDLKELERLTDLAVDLFAAEYDKCLFQKIVLNSVKDQHVLTVTKSLCAIFWQRHGLMTDVVFTGGSGKEYNFSVTWIPIPLTKCS